MSIDGIAILKTSNGQYTTVNLGHNHLGLLVNPAEVEPLLAQTAPHLLADHHDERGVFCVPEPAPEGHESYEAAIAATAMFGFWSRQPPRVMDPFPEYRLGGPRPSPKAELKAVFDTVNQLMGDPSRLDFTEQARSVEELTLKKLREQRDE